MFKALQHIRYNVLSYQTAGNLGIALYSSEIKSVLEKYVQIHSFRITPRYRENVQQPLMHTTKFYAA
jgi:hypothetical protein